MRVARRRAKSIPIDPVLLFPSLATWLLQLRNEEAAIVARELVGNEVLISLNLAWNHFGYDPAIFSLAKFLNTSETINNLDISYNKVKERGSICMADALKQNQGLKTLNMDGNPVGPTGGRALLKMVATEGNMRKISMEHCNFEMPDDGPVPFDVNEPNGFYKLDLSNAYHRSIATSLQELAYTQGGECWRGEKIDGEYFDFPETDPMAWEMPEEGILELAFVSNKPLENSEMNADQFKIVKMNISRNEKADDRRATSLVKQLSDTFAFNSAQVGEMIDEFENSNSKVIVATRLFTQVSDTDNAEKMLAKLNQLERKQVEKKLGQFYYFNSKNPTGHYKLNLSVEFERLVAVRLADVNNTEKLAQRLEGKLDLTQKGNWENFRNETFDGEKWVYASGWKVPHRGIFEFDYVSTVRPESEAEPMGLEEFDEFVRNYITLEDQDEVNEEELKEIFLDFDDDESGEIDVDELWLILKSLGQLMTKKEVQELFDSMDDDGGGSIDFDEFKDLWEGIISRVREQDRLITLRRKSSQVFMSAEQICSMLGMFDKPLERTELFVVFFCRLVDEENMHLALSALSEEEQEVIMHRLGPLNLFNPFQPDGKYKLDLAQHDTHLLAEILIKLGIGEQGKTLHNEHYNGFRFQLPVSWINSVPKKGLFELTFITPDGGLAIRKGGRKTAVNALNPRSTKFIGAHHSVSPVSNAVKQGDGSGWADEESEGDGARGPVINSEGRPTFTLAPNVVPRGTSLIAGLKRKETNAGNTKLRRLVAEELLGWEFMQDEDETDLHNQHEAMARRRSSNTHSNQQQQRSSTAWSPKDSPREEVRHSESESSSPNTFLTGSTSSSIRLASLVQGSVNGEESNASKRRSNFLKDGAGGGENFESSPKRKSKMKNEEERAQRWKNIDRRQQILKLQQKQELAEEKKQRAREQGEADATLNESVDVQLLQKSTPKGTPQRRARRTARLSKKNVKS